MQIDAEYFAVNRLIKAFLATYWEEFAERNRLGAQIWSRLGLKGAGEGTINWFDEEGNQCWLQIWHDPIYRDHLTGQVSDRPIKYGFRVDPLEALPKINE